MSLTKCDRTPRALTNFPFEEPKLKKLCLAVVAGLALSGCTTFLNFDKDGRAMAKLVDAYEFYCDNIGRPDRETLRTQFNDHPVVVARGGSAALGCDPTERVIVAP